MNPSGRIPPFWGWFCFTWHLQRSCSPGSVVAFSPAAGRGCAGCPLKDMSPEPARPPLLASHRCACCTCEEGVFKSCDHVVVSHRHRALTVRKRGECSRWSDHTVKPLLLLLLFFTVFCFLHVLVYWRSSCLKNVTPPFLRRKAAEHFPWEASCILRVNSRILVPWEGVSSLQRWGVTCFFTRVVALKKVELCQRDADSCDSGWLYTGRHHWGCWGFDSPNGSTHTKNTPWWYCKARGWNYPPAIL